MLLVSKCLLGGNCKYNGGNNLNSKVVKFIEGKKYVEVCPECFGGLPTPRDPSEIDSKSGRVYSSKGKDVTENFLKGAEMTLDIALRENAELALLKQSSPSCGCGKIYDGSFSGKKIEGNGITSQLLLENGIKIITEEDL